MSVVLQLTGRNLRMFFRDRTSVFFSLLSAIILYLIYLVFLADLQVNQIEGYFAGADHHDVYGFVITWVFAGIVAVTTISASLSGVGIFVDDRTTGRFADFLVSPVRKWQLTVGYMVSTFAVAAVMSTFTGIIGQIYLAAFGYPVMSGLQMLETFAFLLLSCALYSSVFCFVATFIKSSSAFSAVGTIVGTAGGFLALAFIPAGLLPSSVATVLNALPFAQSALLIRQPFTQNAVDGLAGGEGQGADLLREFYGISASVGDVTITVGLVLGVFSVVIVVFAALSSWRIRRTLR